MKPWVSECDAQKNLNANTHCVQLNCPVPLPPALSGLIKLAYICVSPQRGEQRNPSLASSFKCAFLRTNRSHILKGCWWLEHKSFMSRRSQRSERKQPAGLWKYKLHFLIKSKVNEIWSNKYGIFFLQEYMALMQLLLSLAGGCV